MIHRNATQYFVILRNVMLWDLCYVINFLLPGDCLTALTT